MTVVVEGKGATPLPSGGVSCKSFDKEQADMVERLIQLMVLAERKRCAKIAEAFLNEPGYTTNEAASAYDRVARKIRGGV